MSLGEGSMPQQPNLLVSLFERPKWDMRDSTSWGHRYNSASLRHWNKKADTLRRLFVDHSKISEVTRSFSDASPIEKMRLIELASCFGEKDNGFVASRLMANAMRQYSDAALSTVADQRDFYVEHTVNLTIKPKHFFDGLWLYFDEMKRANQDMNPLYQRRSEEFPNADRFDRYYEQDFIKRGGNHAMTSSRNNGMLFAQSYQKNMDMYRFFGVRFDEEKGELIKINMPPTI